LRVRVLRAVEAGASRREAAECVEVSASSAIKWMQRLNKTGSIAAKPSGGSISPLDAHTDFLLGLIAEQPDIYYLADHYAPYPCVLARLARVDPEALRDLLSMGWRFVSAQKKRPARTRRRR